MMTDQEIAAWEDMERKQDYATLFMSLTAVVFFVAIFVGTLAMSNNYECADGVVTVEQGDTLWGIVEENCSGDIRAAVTAFDVSTFTLQPGQQLQLP